MSEIKWRIDEETGLPTGTYTVDGEMPTASPLTGKIFYKDEEVGTFAYTPNEAENKNVFRIPRTMVVKPSAAMDEFFEARRKAREQE